MASPKTKYLYLAGPITGQTYDQSTSWHRVVQDALPSHIKCVAPMRFFDLSKKVSGPIAPSYEADPMTSAHGILYRNINDINQCEVVLANLLGAQKVSKGTVWEISRAFALGKPVIVVIEPNGNPNDCPHVRQSAGWVFYTLSPAIECAYQLLTPGL